MLKLLPFVLLVGLFLLHGLLPSELLADYYKYTDSKGVVTITNKLESVPARYRSKMKVVREAPVKQAPVAAPAPEPVSQTTAAEPVAGVPAASEAEPAGKFAELCSRYVWFRPLAYIVGIVAIWLVICKVTTLLPSPLLSKVIYISFFMGVMVFMYKAYVEHVVASTKKIKDSAVTMMKKSTQREEMVPPGDAPPAPK